VISLNSVSEVFQESGFEDIQSAISKKSNALCCELVLGLPYRKVLDLRTVKFVGRRLFDIALVANDGRQKDGHGRGQGGRKNEWEVSGRRGDEWGRRRVWDTPRSHTPPPFEPFRIVMI
jgi:hypothetical protein